MNIKEVSTCLLDYTAKQNKNWNKNRPKTLPFAVKEYRRSVATEFNCVCSDLSQSKENVGS